MQIVRSYVMDDVSDIEEEIRTAIETYHWQVVSMAMTESPQNMYPYSVVVVYDDSRK